jgi:hypothetical protein
MSSYLEDVGYLAGGYDDILDASSATVALAAAADETPTRALAPAPEMITLPIIGTMKKDTFMLLLGIIAVVAVYLLIKKSKHKD